jgi:hypothetical protein
MCAIAKLFALILERRLESFQEEMKQVCDEQFGFTKDRRSCDHIFILETLITQTRAQGKQLYIAYVDFQKAYDFVYRDALWWKMIRLGMQGKNYHVLYDMYKSVESIVVWGIERSAVIEQFVGLKKGCVLSPCLFSIFIAAFAGFPRHLLQSGCEGVTLHDARVRVLMYADDCALVAESPRDLQHMLDALYTYCSRWQMIVNVNKTQIVVYRKARKEAVLPIGSNFTYANNSIDIVSQYTYLGIILHETQQEVETIQHRIDQGKKAMAKWLRREYGDINT